MTTLPVHLVKDARALARMARQSGSRVLQVSAVNFLRALAAQGRPKVAAVPLEHPRQLPLRLEIRLDTPSRVDAGETGRTFRALVDRAQAGDRRAADAALAMVRSDVRGIVHQTRASGDLRDRLESAGFWAAWKAISSFDPQRSPAAKAYVLSCIRLRVRDQLGKETARARDLVALDDDQAEQSKGAPDEELAAAEAQALLDRATADLTAADRKIFDRYLAGADLETFPRPGHARRVVETVRGRLVGCRAYSLPWSNSPPATESEMRRLWEMVSK